jgi:hypothetical protein
MPQEESDSDVDEPETFTSKDLRDKTFFFKRAEKKCTEMIPNDREMLKLYKVADHEDVSLKSKEVIRLKREVTEGHRSGVNCQIAHKSMKSTGMTPA